VNHAGRQTGELRRIPLLGTSVNKDKKKERAGAATPQPQP
jgi:hypothetical protein